MPGSKKASPHATPTLGRRHSSPEMRRLRSSGTTDLVAQGKHYVEPARARADSIRDTLPDDRKDVFDRWIGDRTQEGITPDEFLGKLDDKEVVELFDKYRDHLVNEDAPHGKQYTSPDDIRALLVSSKSLKAYIKDKLKSGKFEGKVTELKSSDFRRAYESLSLRDVNSPKTRRNTILAINRRIDLVHAFEDDRSRGIYVRTGNATAENAIHEGLHAVAHPGFDDAFGDRLNEGATQLLTGRALKTLPEPETLSDKYRAEVKVWELMMKNGLVDKTNLKKAYFSGGKYREELRKTLADTFGDHFASLVNAKSGTQLLQAYQEARDYALSKLG